MRVLFSPIGTADPITQLGDGPMLHIVRHYQPDKVVLFLSPDMAAHQESDGRYTKAIEMLNRALDRQIPEIELIRSGRVDVQRFDSYIADFEEEVRKLRRANKRAQILVNVSSGTPAMEQALVALGAFGEYGLTLLQVSTPRNGANKKEDRENPDDYDLETLWALDSDNDSNGSDSRIEEVQLPNFKDRLLTKNIQALIDAYDYEAALTLAEQSSSASDSAINLIRANANRLNLGKTTNNDHDRLKEYLWVLEVRMRQGYWGDFIRSLTPAYTWTTKFALERSGLPQSAYIRRVRRAAFSESAEVLNEEGIRADPKLWGILGGEITKWCSRDGKTPYLSNWMLTDLAREYCPAPVFEKLEIVRNFESASRNVLAHQLFCSDKELLEQRGHATFEEVMAILFQLNSVQPGKYDELNRQIKGELRA